MGERDPFAEKAGPGMNLSLSQVLLPLADFALEIDLTLTHEATALCGPSGAGKTSLLDLLAGLRRPKRGLVQLDGQVLDHVEARVHLPPRRRRIGYVPQDLALFPHLSVRRNLLYGQRGEQGETSGANLFSFEHVTEVLEIQTLADRGVVNLSGGEKQRVALARAILSSPRLLLLDEPLANLDPALKGKILPYLAAIREEFQLPMIYVTHDLSDARILCDRVVALERGRIANATSA